MTSPQETPGVLSTTDEPLTPEAMRARADQLLAAVRSDSKTIRHREREAAQLRYEAGLIEERDLAEAEHKGSLSYLEKTLRPAVAVALAAEADAQQKLRAEQDHLADRQAERAKAEADQAPTELLEELDIRIARCDKAVAKAAGVAASATRAREEAEALVRDRQAYVNGLYAEWQDAKRLAENPGRAPEARGVAPGVDGVSDLDDDTRSLLAATVLLMAELPSGTPAGAAGPAMASGVGWRAQAAQMSRDRFRVVHHGAGVSILPPAGKG